MRVTVGNTVQIDNPSDEVTRWCKRNLVIPNPEYAKKSRMHFWLGDTPKTLSLYEHRGDSLVLPFGTLRSLPTNGAVFSSKFAPIELIDYGADVPLYDYQERAVQAMITAHYGILQSAAGSGKTQMGIAIAARLGRRTLWLCHTLDLVRQSKQRAELYMDKSLIGTIKSGKVNIGKGITFATVQTMCNLDLTQYRDYWDCIIVDEAHRVSGSPTTVTQYQKVLNSLSARHKYGLSATVHRSDGMIRATYALLGEIAYTVTDNDVGDKIMKVSICPVNTQVQLTRACLNTDGTLNYAKLITYLTEHDERNMLIAQMIAEDNRPSLILSTRLDHLRAMMELLPYHMQLDAVMISGDMNTNKRKREREQALADMASGKKKFLFATYALAKEGLDIPRLERLYLATPQKDFAVITQSIGRIARTCEGKQDAVAYDFVDDIDYLVRVYKKRVTTYKKNGCYFI